ncbi:hypothetical protein QEV12_10425 [Trueperella pyogenes]|uniref:hypothetical protein n=1 Tax=Trueperella pyogenes TaxID=1661 RepID=UPI0024BF211D|nr:hypothetical protein [Trueperella pyogenes]WHU59099.1 hypothetical protein QEV21_00250 [Trueperella pyogenes]
MRIKRLVLITAAVSAANTYIFDGWAEIPFIFGTFFLAILYGFGAGYETGLEEATAIVKQGITRRFGKRGGRA